MLHTHLTDEDLDIVASLMTPATYVSYLVAEDIDAIVMLDYTHFGNPIRPLFYVSDLFEDYHVMAGDQIRKFHSRKEAEDYITYVEERYGLDAPLYVREYD